MSLRTDGRRWADAGLAAAALVVLATLAALLFNHFARFPLPLFATWQPSRAWVAIDLQGARKLRGNAIFLDARPAADYSAGHIAGALSLAPDRFEAAFPPLRGMLMRAHQVVIYSDLPSSGAAERLAQRLSGAGVVAIWLCRNGWPAWREAGLATSSGPMP